MSDWLWLVIGAVIWQLVCVIVDIVTKENEEVVLYTAFGIWLLPIIVIGCAFKWLRLQYFKLFYDSYFLMHNNRSVSNHVYISKRMAKKFNYDNTKEYCIIKTSDGNSWKSPPFSYNVYHGEKIFKGHTMDLYKKEK